MRMFRLGNTKLLFALAMAGLLVVSTTAAAIAYDFPSTNNLNREQQVPGREGEDAPHVNLVDVGIGEVTLEFVNESASLAYFEYRIDGEELDSGTPHLVVPNDFEYPGICVDGRSAPVCLVGPVVESFEANEKVEVRLALGGERDWDFDWTPFYVLPDAQTKDDCKKGGWQEYGFKNQGQCIKFVNTGKDSR